MTRIPTPREVIYAWHAAALAGKRPVVTCDPECGFFKRKLVKDGPFVAARIWLQQDIDENGELTGDEVMRCEVNGLARDPSDQWTWLCSRPISEADFNYMLANAQWCQRHAPSAPEALPDAPVNYRNIPPLF